MWLSFILMSILSCSSFPVFTNLTARRMFGYSRWCIISLKEDHSNWGPAQDPSLWTNISLPISETVSSVQLTAMNVHNDMYHNEGGYLAKIMYYSVANNTLTMSIIWWAEPWKLYVGSSEYPCFLLN